MSRAKRLLAILGLAIPLMMFPPTASAQRPGVVDDGPPAGEGGESKGDPLYGYVATAFLAFGVLFIVGKSARR
ncbi:MAG TPA: hypothetical protein VGY53_05230 [Isosphaeraceae bacterium]|nr:hypothetical protein [Isosphaeraceae bacterium]